MAACCGGKRELKEDDEEELRINFETTSIFVSDLNASKKFYVEKFGMAVRVSKTEEIASPEDAKKKMKVAMVLLDTPQNQAKPDGRIEGHLLLMCPEEKSDNYKLNQCKTESRQFGGIAFQCDDMAKSAKKLEDAGVKFFEGKKFGEESGVMGGKGAKCMDPDGTPIILSARPNTGVYKREWNLCQTIIRCSDMDKSEKLITDLGMACVLTNGKGDKMGFKMRWMVNEALKAPWAKAIGGKMPIDYTDPANAKFFGKRKELYGKIEGNYHTNVELIQNKDAKIDVRNYDPMLGFLVNNLKLAKAHLKKCGYGIVWEDKDTFAIKDIDGGYISITEFNPPKI